MQTQLLNVEGMSCGACVDHVTRALQALGGMKTAVVSLEAKTAVVTYDPARVQTPQMLEAVAEEGYEATAASV